MRLVAGVRFSIPAKALFVVIVVLALTAVPAYAATPELQNVLNNLRLWIAGLLATLATLFLSIGGLLYLTAAGNTRRIEQAKDAIRSAIIGYIFAGLAPLVVEIVQKITGV
jgi:Type IV secretion system pilin